MDAEVTSTGIFASFSSITEILSICVCSTMAMDSPLSISRPGNEMMQTM